MKKGFKLIKRSFIITIIALLVGSFFISQVNASFETVTVSNDLQIEYKCQTDLPFHEAIIEDNLFIGISKNSLLLYNIEDICMPVLLYNLTLDWTIHCLTKYGSFIYVVGETLAIIQLLGNSLLMLHEDVLGSESIVLNYPCLYYLSIDDNLLMIANNHELLIGDLSESYYPIFEFKFGPAYMGFSDFELYQHYIIGEYIDPAGHQGTFFFEYNKTTRSLLLFDIIENTYNFVFYNDELYGQYLSKRPYLVKYDFSEPKLLYIEQFVMLDFHQDSRDTIQIYNDYAFLKNSKNLTIYNLRENVFRKISEINIGYNYFFGMINDLLYIFDLESYGIYSLRIPNSLDLNLSNRFFLLLFPVLALDRGVIGRRNSTLFIAKTFSKLKRVTVYD